MAAAPGGVELLEWGALVPRRCAVCESRRRRRVAAGGEGTQRDIRRAEKEEEKERQRAAKARRAQEVGCARCRGCRTAGAVLRCWASGAPLLVAYLLVED
jgi:hypothetical protein